MNKQTATTKKIPKIKVEYLTMNERYSNGQGYIAHISQTYFTKEIHSTSADQNQ